MAAIEQRLRALGLVLPLPLQPPGGMVFPFQFVRIVGSRALIAGHGPQNADGSIAEPRGKVGREVTQEQAYEAARLTALSITAACSACSATLTGSPRGRDCSAWSIRRRASIASPA